MLNEFLKYNFVYNGEDTEHFKHAENCKSFMGKFLNTECIFHALHENVALWTAVLSQEVLNTFGVVDDGEAVVSLTSLLQCNFLCKILIKVVFLERC